MKPTLDDLSTKYEIFDDTNNEIHPTFKPKYEDLSLNKKHHKHDDDVSMNEISSTSSVLVAENTKILYSIVLIFIFVR